MSDKWCSSNVKSDGQGGTNSEPNNDLLDLKFDSSSTAAPALRQPNLSEAQLLAALEFGFSQKYLPSSVAGKEPVSATQGSSSVLDKGTNKPGQSSSMINNHSNSNNNQGSGGSQNQYPLFVDNYSFNLTDEQQEGLLPPLRRPDINQLPPDVLAVLLKSTRFEEILIPTQRRLTEITPNQVNNGSSSRTTTAAEPDIIRGGVAGNSGASNSSPNRNAVQSPSSSSSAVLSPFAKEFVPKSFQTGSTTMNSQRDTNELAYAMSQVQVQGQNDSFQGFIEELDGSDCILSTVTDMISQVSKDPASLNRCAKVTVDVLKKHLNDDDTLGIVVTLLVEQMISNSNFCYSGAKILELLRENGIGVGENSIKNLVLTRMHEEFTHCLNNLDDPEVRNRSLGVLRLLSELYMNFAVLPDNSKLYIFGLAVLELMEKLIQKDKSLDSVKCVCQLLKLIGWEVENSKNEKVREYFGLVLKELSYMRMTSEGKLHPTCESLVDMIFKLHSNNWNRGQEESSTPSATSASYAATMQSRNPVYYELPDSDDDSFGDDVGIMIDDEPDEVQAAYEEFLKMNSK